MLDLRSAHKALNHFHHNFIDGSMQREISLEAFKRFDKKAYDKQQLAWGVEAWQLRTLDEYRSQVAFTFLLSDLTQLGFSFDVLGTAMRVVRDEARHVEICRRLVKAFGGSDQIKGEPSYAMPDANMPVMRRVLHSIVGALCIGETISVKLISSVRKSTLDPLTHEALTCLAADESIHGRFGWIMLELLWPHASPDDRASILQMLPTSLRSAERIVVPAGRSALMDRELEPITTAPISPFGAISDHERAQVFYGAFDEVIARFATLGIKSGI